MKGLMCGSYRSSSRDTEVGPRGARSSVGRHWDPHGRVRPCAPSSCTAASGRGQSTISRGPWESAVFGRSCRGSHKDWAGETHTRAAVGYMGVGGGVGQGFA